MTDAVTLVRYMKRSHLEAFFGEGSLRLSSFTAFRHHADEQRGDAVEGTLAMRVYSPSLDFSMLGVMGEEAYVFCGTTAPSAALMEQFGCDAGLRIKNLPAFITAIAAQVPGCIGHLAGPCEYRDSIIERETTEPFPIDVDSITDATAAMRTMSEYVVRQHGNEPFFLKATRFRHQCEYRVIWVAGGNPRTYLDLKCPEARQWCEPIY